jgi:hypothetical protein
VDEKQPSSERDLDLAEVMWGRGPCTYLLVSLLAIILVFPYLENALLGRVALGIMFSMTMLGGVHAIGHSRRALIFGTVLAASGVSLQWLALLNRDDNLLAMAGGVFAVLIATMIAETLRYLLKRGPITADKLHGALAGYIMIAIFWAFLYAVVERSSPGSFHPGALDFHEPGALFRLIYFSFTVLTTTGFGDITPATDQARSLVIIEEFAGVFFVGVLIARLAGLYPSSTKH